MSQIEQILVSVIIAFVVLVIVMFETRRAEAETKKLFDSMRKDLRLTAVVLDQYHKFKVAFENSYDAMVIADKDGKILFMNDSAARITGFTRSEAVGSKAGVLWGKLMPKSFSTKLWKRIKKEKKPFLGKFTNHRKNGERYTAQATITPILDEEGKNVEFFVAVERDLSDPEMM